MDDLECETFDNINDKNTTYALMKEMDEIINKSRDQISQVQSRINTPRSITQNIHLNYEDNTNISEKITNSEIKNESRISNIPILNLNLENENLKLQSALTLERINSQELTMKLKHAEKEIEKLKQQLKENQILNFNTISEYKNKRNKIEKKYLSKNKSTDINNNYENKSITELYTETNEKLKKENEIMQKELKSVKTIIKTFFDFYNKNLNLCNELKIIKSDYNPVIYDECDITGTNNFSKVHLVFETIDKLMRKLILNSQEFDNKIKLRDIDKTEIENLKHENKLLKSQLQKFINK